MANKRFYWIKLKTDFFNRTEIDFLMSQKNGSNYIVLYQMLCLMTANNDGELTSRVGEMIIPYDVDKIVRETKYFDRDTVIIALDLYAKLGLIYQGDDDVMRIADFGDMVGSQSDSAERVQRFRERKKLAQSCEQLPEVIETYEKENVTKDVTEDVTELLHCNADEPLHRNLRDIEIRDKENRDKELDFIITDSKESVSPNPTGSYTEIQRLYNEICKSFPKCVKLSERRRRAIGARMRAGYTLEDFKKLFEKAEQSEFLKGKNGRDWRADFDWLLKDANIVKVLEGRYDERTREDTRTKDYFEGPHTEGGTLKGWIKQG